MKEINTTELGSGRFIVRWTILIVGGLVLVFFGCLSAYENTPLLWHISSAEAITGCCAVAIVGLGILMLLNKNVRQRHLGMRKAALVVTLGVFMLAGFFAFKSAIPLIFG